MRSLTQWTWVWASSWRQDRELGMLQLWGFRVGHNWVTEKQVPAMWKYKAGWILENNNVYKLGQKLHVCLHSYIPVCEPRKLSHFLICFISRIITINPMNSMKRHKNRTLKDELLRSVGAQYATGDKWRNNFIKKEEMESKQK